MDIACILDHDYEDSEFRIPYDRITAAGPRVIVIGRKKGEQLHGKRGQDEVRVDRSIDEVDPKDYAALLIPGGYSPDRLRADQRFVDFVKAFDRTRRPIAAVCHGPQILITAGLVKGRTMTAWRTIQTDLRHAGANVEDLEVVVDGNWITSRMPEDLEAFSRELLAVLGVAETTRP